MTRIARWLLLSSVLIALGGPTAHAQTINAASCSASAVQAALNSVAADGTTVTIPAGTCTWSSTVNYTANFSTTIQGQTTVSGTCAPGGSCTVADNTVISESIASRPASCGSGDAPTFHVGTVTGKSFRMTGITWQHSGNPTCLGTVDINGQGKAIRLDHNHFVNTSFVAIGFFGGVYGVVDHNLFSLNGTQNTIKFQSDSWNNSGDGQGDASWNDATTFGSNRFVFVENNNLLVANGTQNHGNSYANDCIQGGRYVWRYNVMQNLMLQTHPTKGGGIRQRGCRAQEIYGNSFVATAPNTSNNMFNAFWLSAGTALVWNNTTSPSGGYDQFVTVHSMRRNNNTYGSTSPPSGFGYCGTSFNGTGSNWDQNSNTNSGRKCLDRPGMGVGDLLTGGFTSDGSGSNNVKNVTTGCISSQACAWPRQALEPMYEWLNNTPVNAPFYWDVFDGEMLSNEDYYNYTNSFNGTAGVGSGTLAARPATCTPNPDSSATGGVAYWATDQGNWNQSGSGGQGQLSVCTGTNSWSTYYTPYTYPHPLAAGSGILPTPPTNLQSVVH